MANALPISTAVPTSTATQSVSRQNTESAPHQPIIEATRLALHTSRGPVYGPVDLCVRPGVTVFHGPVGSGRTTLLLTLAGRMRPDRGSTLTTLGHSLPRAATAVQQLTAIAGFQSIDDIDDNVTIAALIRERESWVGPPLRFIHLPQSQRVTEILKPVFGDHAPAGNTPVYELSDIDKLLVKIALALMSSPKILFIDSIEQIQAQASRARIWLLIDRLAQHGLNVVVAAAGDDRAMWQGLAVQPALIRLDRATSLNAHQSHENR